jgi:FtsH-binding integral membrane protein
MALANSRPIDGAVATLGVSDRVAFLRKVYAHLTVALIGFAVISGGMMRFATELSWKFSSWAVNGRYTWLAVMGAFMLVGVVTDRLAKSQSSRGLQYMGLALAVVAEGVILQPMLWVLFIKFGKESDFNYTMSDSGQVVIHSFVASSMAIKILTEAIVITLAIFVGLSATVFVTKKDFSFMRGALVIATFAALGVIIASILFGFQLGAIFSGAMILLMALYILYQTSLVMKHYPPQHYVAASLMLFSTIATLFWYVLRLLMELNRR